MPARSLTFVANAVLPGFSPHENQRGFPNLAKL
jgi:hypothetical protein